MMEDLSSAEHKSVVGGSSSIVLPLLKSCQMLSERVRRFSECALQKGFDCSRRATHNWLSQALKGEFLSRLSVEPENFTGRIIFMSMFNDISWGSKEIERECELSAQLVSMYAKRFSVGRWSFLGPGSERSGVVLTNANHKENGTESLNK